MRFSKDRRDGIGSPGFGHDTDSGYSVGSLYYDSASGITWLCQDSTAGAALWHPVAANRAIPSRSYFGPDWVIGAADSSAIAPDLLTLQPIVIQERVQVDRMSVVLVTAGSAGSVVRLMLYNSLYGLPVRLRKDFGEVSLEGAAGLKEGVSGTTLLPGTYFMAAMFKSVTTMPVVKRVSQAAMFGVPVFSSTPFTSGNAARGMTMSQSYGAAPTSVTAEPADSNGGNIPLLMMRRS